MQVKKHQLEPCMEQLTGSRLRKEYNKAVCYHPVYLYAEHIMRNARLDELQFGIKTGRKNINNFRYVDYTTLMAESEDELKNLLMRVKEDSEKAGLKLNIKKTKIKASSSITLEVEGERVEDFHFLALKSLQMVTEAIKLDVCFLAGKL